MTEKYGDKSKMIVEMLQDGKSSKEIIEKVGCTKSTISYHRANLKNGKPLADILEHKTVLELVEQGLTTLEISNKLNRDRSTISRICKTLGVDPTKPETKIKFNVSKNELEEMLKVEKIVDIAKKYDVTIQTVYNKIRQFEL